MEPDLYRDFTSRTKYVLDELKRLKTDFVTNEEYELSVLARDAETSVFTLKNALELRQH